MATHGPGWTTRAYWYNEAKKQRRPGDEDTRGSMERILGTLNRRFVSSVPHQNRSWSDSPERRATNLREQEAARARKKGLRRP